MAPKTVRAQHVRDESAVVAVSARTSASRRVHVAVQMQTIGSRQHDTPLDNVKRSCPTSRLVSDRASSASVVIQDAQVLET